MKKATSIFLLLFVCFHLGGCSFVESLLVKIPFFEDSDVNKLTDKAEKAWEEVGKGTLKDAANDAKDALFGEPEEKTWPETDETKGIPQPSSGTVSEVKETASGVEIVIKEFSKSGYDEYISSLSASLGDPMSTGLYRYEDRLISVSFNEENSVMTVTVSSVPPRIEITDDSSEDDSDSSFSTSSEDIEGAAS